MPTQTIIVGDAAITPDIRRGFLRSIGQVKVGKTRLRNTEARFLPWFDTYDGDVFRSFRFLGIEQRGGQIVINTRAVSDPDVVFRERRDSSGDLCFRNASWDAPPHEADFRIVVEPARDTIDGRSFTGFKYWFEYDSDSVAIHRLLDRQTWEVGGNLNDVTVCLRNWLTPPRMKIGRDTTYSTVGLDKWASLLPGNMWARWSLLPSFDLQYGRAGIVVGRFDRVSLIRTAVETNAGDNSLRFFDLHFFEQSKSVRTNPKTILHCPDRLDATDALNLWTRVYDLEQERACRQLGINEEGPPAIVFSRNVWRGMRFDTTYEHTIDVAAQFGADCVFIDPIWEHQQAYAETLDELIPPDKQKGTIIEKFWQQNMCVTLDFEVAAIMGGEAGLKALCDRAAAKGLKIISWMAAHYSPNSALQNRKDLGTAAFSIFAGRESGRHPDTGYPSSCWAANLNAPIARKMHEQIIGVCKRTGLAGYLWDSFSNLGWWQVDFPQGTMRPQWDKMAELYAALANDGLYVMPEGIAMFSNHSCCGMHGGNIYKHDLLGYTYNSALGPWYDHTEDPGYMTRVIKGEAPIDAMFQSVAHKHLPTFEIHDVPAEQWSPPAVVAVKDLLAVYKRNRHLMRKRTVLKNDAGVLWESPGGEGLLFSFAEQRRDGAFTDALTGQPVTGKLQANRAYRTTAAPFR